MKEIWGEARLEKHRECPHSIPHISDKDCKLFFTCHFYAAVHLKSGKLAFHTHTLIVLFIVLERCRKSCTILRRMLSFYAFRLCVSFFFFFLFDGFIPLSSLSAVCVGVDNLSQFTQSDLIEGPHLLCSHVKQRPWNITLTLAFLPDSFFPDVHPQMAFLLGSCSHFKIANTGVERCGCVYIADS